MQRIKLLIFNLLLLGSSTCFAQYSDRQLYRAYLTRDMKVWEDYLANTDFANASVEEQKRYINYQYGYVAYAISQKQGNARELLDQFEANLRLLQPNIPQSTYLAYKASTDSYELSLNHWLLAKYGKQIYSEIDKAVSLAPDDPLALTMKGNVEFYGPMGSKHEALKHYRKADSLYHAQPSDMYLWNMRAVQLTLVQCIEKTEGVQAAIQCCNDILAEEPDFFFIRDTYLPALKKK